MLTCTDQSPATRHLFRRLNERRERKAIERQRKRPREPLGAAVKRLANCPDCAAKRAAQAARVHPVKDAANG